MPIISRPAFHENSRWERLRVNGNEAWRFLAWKVVNDREHLLVVINFTGDKGYAQVVVPDAASGTLTVTELMTNQAYQRSGDEMRSQGLGVVVDAWNGQIFKY